MHAILIQLKQIKTDCVDISMMPQLMIKMECKLLDCRYMCFLFERFKIVTRLCLLKKQGSLNYMNGSLI